MRYLALATDYDGTLATHGTVDQETIASLRRLVDSGRKLIMATGREVPDLKRVFPNLEFFSFVVAENGALLYDPATSNERLLCDPASELLLKELQRKGIPASVGRAVIATVQPHEDAVRRLIMDLGLPLEISLNKGSVMVLPEGVSKVTGLREALAELGLSERAVVGIGDAENDMDFISVCGCGVAVANATPQLKLRADLVTRGTHGSGVVEVIDQLLVNDRLACDDRLVPNQSPL